MVDLTDKLQEHILRQMAAELMKSHPRLVVTAQASFTGRPMKVWAGFSWAGGLVVKDSKTGQVLAQSYPLGDFRLWLPPGVVR